MFYHFDHYLTYDPPSLPPRYGDVTPVTKLARIFTLFWSLTGIILVGRIVGGISESLSNEVLHPTHTFNMDGKVGYSCFYSITLFIHDTLSAKKGVIVDRGKTDQGVKWVILYEIL